MAGFYTKEVKQNPKKFTGGQKQAVAIALDTERREHTKKGMGGAMGPKPDFDPVQLLIGTIVEMEHTGNLMVAQKIAKDHLKEIPDYYTRLLAMESQAKKEGVKKGYTPQGKMNYCGIPVNIENRKGSIREGVGANGTPWRTKMTAPYGYIPGVKGNDGEGVDVFVASKKKSPVYIVHQKKDDGSYDEDKVILGAESEEKAKETYLNNYDTDEYLGPIDKIDVDKLKEILDAAGNKKISNIGAERSIDEDVIKAMAYLLQRSGMSLSEFDDLVKARKAVSLESTSQIAKLATNVMEMDRKKLDEVSGELFGDLYDYGDASDEQVAMEITGFLIDMLSAGGGNV